MDRKENREIEKKIAQILVDKLDIDAEKIKLESSLVEDLGIDSFGAVELSFELKEQFGIEILQENFNKIKKVKDIVEYISTRINKR